MEQYESVLELQRLTEESEIAAKKLEEAKSRLQNVQKQCIESKNETEMLKHELETLNLKELTLNRMISSKTEKAIELQTECEKTCKKLDVVLWRRKIMEAKLALESNNRRHYENKMNTPIELDCFLTDGYGKNVQEVEDLKNNLNALQQKVLEKQKLNAECEKSFLESHQSNNKHLETLQEMKKNIDNVEILIDQQEEELQKLLSNEAE